MTSAINRLTIAVASALLSLCALAADVRVSLPGGGSVLLPAADDWKQANQAGFYPTLLLTPRAGNSFQVLVSPLVRPDGGSPHLNAQQVHRLVSSSAQGALSQSVEKSLSVQELRGPGVQGYYFAATDRAPKRGEFTYMTQGVILVQELPVTFTILSNGDPGAVVGPALEMLRNARREQ